MNILVTGGSGFIGSWVTYYLLRHEEGGVLPEAADSKVVVVDNLSNSHATNLAGVMNHPNFLGLYPVDLMDRDVLEWMFSRYGFDLCYHLAASVSVQKSIDDPAEGFLKDVAATFNLLDECRMHGTRLVYVSTCMVYAPAEDRAIDELHPIQCSSPYAASKLASERLVESYNHAYGLWTVTLRPFNTYGPNQRFDEGGGVVSRFLWRRLTGEPITIFGDGRQERDLMYVTDCARFIVNAGFNLNLNGLTLNAGSGRAISIRELARLISSNEADVKYVEHPHSDSEKRRLVCDYSLANRLLGWSPVVGLEQGLALTEGWIKESYRRMKEEVGEAGIA